MGLFVDRVVSSVESGSPLGVFRRADVGDKGSVMGRFLALLMTVVVALTACSGEEAAPTTSSSTTTSTTQPNRPRPTSSTTTTTTTTSTTEAAALGRGGRSRGRILCGRTRCSSSATARCLTAIRTRPSRRSMQNRHLAAQVIGALQVQGRGRCLWSRRKPGPRSSTEVFDVVVDEGSRYRGCNVTALFAADLEYSGPIRQEPAR